MCNMLNNGFVTGLLWSAGTGVVIGNALNNGFVTGRFKRLPLLCFQYMPQYNKRVALSWGGPFFVVVHLLYNRRL